MEGKITVLYSNLFVLWIGNGNPKVSEMSGCTHSSHLICLNSTMTKIIIKSFDISLGDVQSMWITDDYLIII
jgi:hypothetical protein